MVNIPKQGILVFEDKGNKFVGAKHSLTNLIDDCDIKVGTQDKNGKPVSLTIEVSEAGTLDKDTFQRKEDATVLCEKMSYEKMSPKNLFGAVSEMTYALKYMISKGLDSEYYAVQGLRQTQISEEDYKNIDYVL